MTKLDAPSVDKRSSADIELMSSPDPVQDVGPSHQSRSTPVWKTPSAAVVAAEAAPMSKSGIIGSPIVKSRPMPIATTCGYRCQMHIAQGA